MFGEDSLDKMLLDAMKYGDGIKKAKALMEQGVSIHTRDINGWTALHFAAYYGQVKNIGWLLNQGFNVNCRTYGGETPYACAMSLGRMGAINFLRIKGGQF